MADLTFGDMGTDSYESPNYTDMQGLVRVLLHEIGHVSQAGYDNLKNEYKFYKMDYENTNAFYTINQADLQSAYNIDNKRFINDYAKAAADAVGFPLTGYDATYGVRMFEGAGNIYADRHNHHNVVVGRQDLV